MIIYEEVLKAFHRRRVKYVLVGGIAVNLLGALRATADLDILAEMTDQNLRKIVEILKKQGYRIRQPVDPMGFADQRTRQDWIEKKHMKALNFYRDRDFKQVDIIIESPVRFEQAYKNASRIQAGRLRLPVISIDDLIRMKKKAGRYIDKTDLADLKKIKQIKRKRR